MEHDLELKSRDDHFDKYNTHILQDYLMKFAIIELPCVGSQGFQDKKYHRRGSDNQIADMGY